MENFAAVELISPPGHTNIHVETSPVNHTVLLVRTTETLEEIKQLPKHATYKAAIYYKPTSALAAGTQQ